VFLNQNSAIAGNKIPNRLQQRDLDAGWIKKNGINRYGYKNSIALMMSTVLSDGYWLAQEILINYISGHICTFWRAFEGLI